MSGAEVMIIGLVLTIGAVGLLLTAAVAGLAALLVSQGFSDTSASALASLIIGILVGLVAWALISKGLSALRGSSMSLPRTATSLRRDVGVVKERI